MLDIHHPLYSLTMSHHHNRQRHTYELKGQNGRITYLTTAVPPAEWTERFTDCAFKATGQAPLNTWSRRVHFTPPHLLRKGFSVNLVEPKPHVPQPRYRYPTPSPYAPQCHPNLPLIPDPALNPFLIPIHPHTRSRSRSRSRERGRLAAPVVPPVRDPNAGLFPCLRRSLSRSRSRERRSSIYFYGKNDPYYGFTNFSQHQVVYEAKCYFTSEHLYQSLKVCSAAIAHRLVLTLVL